MNWVELSDQFRLGLTIAKMRANPVEHFAHECEILNGRGLRVLPRTLPTPQRPFSTYAGLISHSPTRRIREPEGVPPRGDGME